MSDIVDLLEDSPSPAEPSPPTDDQLRQAIKAQLIGKDLSTISLKALRLDLEKGFHLPVGGLDSRKGDIRQLAQDLVVEAQNAPATATPAPVTPVEPAAKKRRTLTQAIPTAPAPATAAPASPVKTKGPKRKAAPTAYSLWSLEHRATVTEELERELQRKPTFGEISKAVPERWKAVSEADRAVYEEKAKTAKAEQAMGHVEVKEKPKKAPAETNRKGKGKGKGKGKDREEPPMSRAEFFAASPVINCAFQIPGVQADECSMNNLAPRMFKSQGLGWFSSTKFQVPVGSKQVTVQAQVVMNVAGSKHWNDGEGLDEVLKNLEQKDVEAASNPGLDSNVAKQDAGSKEAEAASNPGHDSNVAKPDAGSEEAEAASNPALDSNVEKQNVGSEEAEAASDPGLDSNVAKPDVGSEEAEAASNPGLDSNVAKQEVGSEEAEATGLEAEDLPKEADVPEEQEQEDVKMDAKETRSSEVDPDAQSEEDAKMEAADGASEVPEEEAAQTAESEVEMDAKATGSEVSDMAEEKALGGA